ncbi:hypothetical protein EVAR_93507_1 [Eumeta japonica]|uniref:Uncharacterized protein n=1 Tax=Eumeta variegata TaxID=151549 RepID=A0A4C1TKB7_EUMVA|nr:hypothetical protein EVAR_93507_1 [Eumeta japonica]
MVWCATHTIWINLNCIEQKVVSPRTRHFRASCDVAALAAEPTARLQRTTIDRHNNSSNEQGKMEIGIKTCIEKVIKTRIEIERRIQQDVFVRMFVLQLY